MRKWINGFAQVGLVFFLTCVIVPIVALIYRDETTVSLALVELISDLPVLNVWTEILGQLVIGKDNPEVFFNATAYVYVSAFTESLLMGVVVHIINTVKNYYEKLKGRGTTFNILSTFLGIVVTFILGRVFDLATELAAIIMELGTIFIMLIGIKIMVKSILRVKLLNFKEFWYAFVDSVYAVLVCGYITKIVLIMSGNFVSFPIAIVELVIYSLVLALSGILAYLMTGKKTIDL